MMVTIAGRPRFRRRETASITVPISLIAVKRPTTRILKSGEGVRDISGGTGIPWPVTSIRGEEVLQLSSAAVKTLSTSRAEIRNLRVTERCVYHRSVRLPNIIKNGEAAMAYSGHMWKNTPLDAGMRRASCQRNDALRITLGPRRGTKTRTLDGSDCRPAERATTSTAGKRAAN